MDDLLLFVCNQCAAIVRNLEFLTPKVAFDVMEKNCRALKKSMEGDSYRYVKTVWRGISEAKFNVL